MKTEITKAPKTKPAKENGVATGMLVTLSDSVGLVNGTLVHIPAGELISSPISGGYNPHVGGMSECRVLANGSHVTYQFK